jgi:hypothetical protein
MQFTLYCCQYLWWPWPLKWCANLWQCFWMWLQYSFWIFPFENYFIFLIFLELVIH